MTTEQKIEQGAKEHDNRFQPPIEQFTYWRVNSFTAGASFYREQILPGVMEQFAEWERDNVIADGAPKRLYKDGKRYTTAELVTLFLSHLKHNQDAG